jgi:hypothetical protein
MGYLVCESGFHAGWQKPPFAVNRSRVATLPPRGSQVHLFCSEALQSSYTALALAACRGGAVL